MNLESGLNQLCSRYWRTKYWANAPFEKEGPYPRCGIDSQRELRQEMSIKQIPLERQRKYGAGYIIASVEKYLIDALRLGAIRNSKIHIRPLRQSKGVFSWEKSEEANLPALLMYCPKSIFGQEYYSNLKKHLGHRSIAPNPWPVSTLRLGEKTWTDTGRIRPIPIERRAYPGKQDLEWRREQDRQDRELLKDMGTTNVERLYARMKFQKIKFKDSFVNTSITSEGTEGMLQQNSRSYGLRLESKLYDRLRKQAAYNKQNLSELIRKALEMAYPEEKDEAVPKPHF